MDYDVKQQISNGVKIRVVILAAGKGKRMQSTFPKVLTPVGGKAIIRRLLDAVAAAGVDARPVIVVGHGAENVRAALGEGYDYVVQEEQRGTGHAVQATQSLLVKSADHLVVLYGDHPFISPETIRTLAQSIYSAPESVLTLLTATAPDFYGWRSALSHYGRIIRGEHNAVVGVIEEKDATPDERALREVNAGMYRFAAPWLWEKIHALRDENQQHEYYLTDMVALALADGKHITALPVAPIEALGVNTQEDYAAAEASLRPPQDKASR